jgi:hypothetical protein
MWMRRLFSAHMSSFLVRAKMLGGSGSLLDRSPMCGRRNHMSCHMSVGSGEIDISAGTTVVTPNGLSKPLIQLYKGRQLSFRSGNPRCPMRLTDPLANGLIPACYFGGAPKPPKPQKIKPPKPISFPAPPPPPKFEMPKQSTAAEIAAAMPKPIPPVPIPPPPSTASDEALMAEEEQKKRQARRQGQAASIIAGEQGQEYVSSATGSGSLLG